MDATFHQPIANPFAAALKAMRSYLPFWLKLRLLRARMRLSRAVRAFRQSITDRDIVHLKLQMLRNAKCPVCKHQGKFLLEQTDTVTVLPDGTLDFAPDVWGLDIECECPTCGFSVELQHFVAWEEADVDDGAPADPLLQGDQL